MAHNAYLKIDGIPGESTAAKYTGQIDVLSFSFGASNTSTMGMGGGGGQSGKASIRAFVIHKEIDKASPKLFQACCTGQHIKKVVLSCCKPGGQQQEFLTYTFSDVMISDYSTGDSEGVSAPNDAGSGVAAGRRQHSPVSIRKEVDEASPLETISLNFSKIEVSYNEQKPDGSMSGAIKGGYDLAAGKPV